MINRFQDNAANERTFLSWIRTAMTIAGFGIVIEKLQGSTDAVVGYVLVGSSALLVLFSLARFLFVRNQLSSEKPDDGKFALIETMFALMLAALMGIILVFLTRAVF